MDNYRLSAYYVEYAYLTHMIATLLNKNNGHLYVLSFSVEIFGCEFIFEKLEWKEELQDG